eukprot:1118753_1
MLRFSGRLRIQQILRTTFASPSHAQHPLSTLNPRFIQSLTFNHTQSTIHSKSSKRNTSPHHQSLQHMNRRHFSLPEHELIGLPALSPSVEESKIVAWKKNEGEFVAADEAIATVQTDKAELDWQVTDDVYLAKILLQAGTQVPIGTPACIFVENEKDITAFANYAVDTPQTPPPSAVPSTPPTAPPTSTNYPEHKVEGMPALSPTATDGALVEWLVKEGDMVEEGTGIAEIQTDKSVVTWTATDEAYIAKLLVAVSADDRLPVGTPLAVFVDEQSDVSAFKDYVIGSAAPPSNPAPTAKVEEAVTATPTQPADAATTTSTSKSKEGARVFASPYAKKLAAEMGIKLEQVRTASGDRGRIVSADVIKASQQQQQQAKVTPSETVAVPKPVMLSGERTYEDIPVSVMREIIGARLSESKFTSPHFYVTQECVMDSLVQMRQEMNDGETVKISVNDFVVKACAAALRETPECNVGWIVEGNNKAVLRQYSYVDISVAVATPSGLITPIIKDADKKSIAQVSMEMKDLAVRARDNKLLPDEFQGGTFTISNMGMFGVSNFTAIINPPQACILAVGGAKQKLVPDDSDPRGFKTVSAMQITLSSDHRAVDGAMAARLVNNIQKYIQKPAKLML